MRTFFITLLLICGWASTYGQAYYCYTPEGKTELKRSTKKILLHFSDEPSATDRQRVLSTFPLLVHQKPVGFLVGKSVFFYPLPENTTSVEVTNLLDELQRHPAIMLAHPFWENPDGTLISYDTDLIVALKSMTDFDLLEDFIEANYLYIQRADKYNPHVFYLSTTTQTEADPLALANELMESGQFLFAEPDYIMQLKRYNDPLLSSQWYIDNNGGWTNSIPGVDMNVTDAWGEITTTNNVTVAVLDDGVQLDHPDLVGNLVTGYDATGNGTSGAPTFLQDAHGTGCAGIIAARAGNGIGIRGIAHEAKVMPIRIAYNSIPGEGWTSLISWQAAGVNWAWQQGADILSNSWGGGNPSFTLDLAMNNAVDNGRNGKGSIVLFAAGNDNSSIMPYPARNPLVIAVGATSHCDERKSPTSCDGENWWGSNYGSQLDVAAPGVKMTTTDLTGTAGANSTSAGFPNSADYRIFNGTSSATPATAGVMALMLTVNPELTEEEARNILEQTCAKVGGYSYNNSSLHPNGTWSSQLGYGRVDAHAAVLAALNGDSGGDDYFIVMRDPFEISPTPIITNEVSTVSFNVRNDGNGPMTGLFGLGLWDENGQNGIVLDHINSTTLPPNHIFTNGLDFDIDFDYPPGDYLLGAIFQPAGGEWTFVDDGEHQATIPITIIDDSPPATLTLSEYTIDIGPMAQTEEIQLFSNCSSWSVSENVSWLSVSPSSGSGDATLVISFPEHTGSNDRNTTITVVGCGISRNILVNQAAQTSFITLSNTTLTTSAGANELIVGLESNCNNWSVSDNASWLSVSPESGSQDALLTLSLQANTGSSSRTATVTVTGCGITRTMTVTQGAEEITLTASPSFLFVDGDAGTATFTVTTNCTDWRITNAPSWASFSPDSGVSTTTVTVSYPANPTTEIRAAQIEISGCGITRTIAISQSPGTPSPEIPWEASPTGINHTLIIPADLMSDISGETLVVGDYIGAFFDRNGTATCSNFTRWEGTNTTLAIFGDDSDAGQAKNGFANGESFQLRVYQSGTDEAIAVGGTYAPVGTNGIITHQDAYASDGISMLLGIELATLEVRNIDLDPGWNMISTNVHPVEGEMLTLLAGIADQVIILKDGAGQSVLPAFGINNIGDWNRVEGYQVKVTDATQLSIEGHRADLDTSSIQLNGGWQLVSHLPDAAVDAAALFSDIADAIEIVKNNAGQSYIPAFGINTIGTLQTGQGYKVKASTAATLRFADNVQPPTNETTTALSGGLTDLHFSLDSTLNTGNNAQLVFPASTLSDFLQAGDEIGIFNTEGTLCGAAIFTGQNLAITVWGDDATTTDTLEGMTPGEAYEVRIWQWAEQLESPMETMFQSGDGLYGIDDLEVISQLDFATPTADFGFPESTIRLYPNPAHVQVTIELPPRAIEIQLLDFTGAMLKTEQLSPGQTKHQLSLQHLPTGTYFLRVRDVDGKPYPSQPLLVH
ncbi:MAG: S8 family serine peptidase [Bacteroidota bacterium]